MSALLGGCIDRGTFVCELDGQCGEEGRCEASGFCSRPDEACPSGRRYSEVSGFGRVCVMQEATTSSSTGSPLPMLDAGSEPGPVPGERCGNGQLDPGEVCDDGNRIASDGCEPYCVEPGSTIWETTYDSETNGEDRAFAIALSDDGETIAVAGVSSVAQQGLDALVQLYDSRTGALVWTRTFGGDAARDDSAEEVVFDDSGDIVVTGRLDNEGTGGDLWLAKLDPGGDTTWAFTFDDMGGDDKGHSLDVSPDGQLVVGGHVGRDVDGDEHSDIYLARFSEAGELLAPATVVAGEAGGRDEAIDVRVDDAGIVYATGWIRTSVGPSVWTAAYGPNLEPRWEDVYTAAEPGSVDRGVGLRFDPDGNVVVAGTAAWDIWVRRYAPDGTPLETLTHAGDADLLDEASDVVFDSESRFVVTGFTGFATTGFARSDIWIRGYDASRQERWTVTHDGAAAEIDKALAVVGPGDGSVIAAGYVTTPGQIRDVWLRKIAL